MNSSDIYNALVMSLYLLHFIAQLTTPSSYILMMILFLKYYTNIDKPRKRNIRLSASIFLTPLKSVNAST